MLLTVGVCGAVSAATARLLWRRTSSEGSDPASLIRDLLPTVALVLLATATAVPGSPTAAVVLLWSIIAAEEIAAAWFARWPHGRREQRRIATLRQSGGRSTARPLNLAAKVDSEVANDIWQHQTRQRATDGKELVHGTLRSGFVAGQRTAIEHLVFCPMLAVAPQISAMAVDEADCTVRATHVYRYGARLELRLKEPCDEPVEVLIRYEARG
jgi:hypothetical protein